MISAQHLPTGIVQEKIPEVIDALTSVLDDGSKKPRFTSSTIEHETMNALGRLIVQTPQGMKQICASWLPLIYSRLLSDSPV